MMETESKQPYYELILDDRERLRFLMRGKF